MNKFINILFFFLVTINLIGGLHMEFVFEKDILRDIKDNKYLIIYEDLPMMKGLLADDKPMINLSAEQWKDLDEELILKQVVQVGTHELCHKEIRRMSPSETRYTPDGEEKICQILAGETENETFLYLKL